MEMVLMATAEIYQQATRVLAEIKSGVSKARVRELQREYASLQRQYAKAAAADWAAAPLTPAGGVSA
jgi:hypothetical protein